eukprot:TRINITY_DN34528_c0_g1_i1.p1 TRINITY_DN34528_c0_g1~~TRINITY_DN34528_c0_g1_i1.p1  ORF type:complete len:492 (+),score=94.17 TRINITY_DN34528_c0_g1_i1:89-1564(+)
MSVRREALLALGAAARLADRVLHPWESLRHLVRHAAQGSHQHCPRSLGLLGLGSLFLGTASSVVFAEEGSYYDILGVSKTASEQEIKKAYKRAAVKFHPDKAPEGEREQYEERFKRISRAYEILSNPEKRRIYDARGEAAFEGNDAGGPGAGGFEGHDPFEMFRSMFGQGFDFGGGFGPRRTPDVGYEMEVTLEELYKGFTRNLRYEQDVVCSSCRGRGATRIDTCTVCRGAGVVVESRQVAPGYYQRYQRTCGACGGQGATVAPGNICSTCRGSGLTQRQVDLPVEARPGCPDGQQFVFQGKADESPGMETGNVVVQIKEKKHALFSRVGDEDLLMTRHVSLLDALTGIRFTVRHLDGKDLEVSSAEGEVVRPGAVWVLKGYGMPKRNNPGSHGDLFIRFEIDFPDAIPAPSSGSRRDVLRPLIDPKAAATPSSGRSWFGGGGGRAVVAGKAPERRARQVEDFLEMRKHEEWAARQRDQRQRQSGECRTM